MDKSKLPIEYNRSYPNGIPYVSIVIATYNKAGILDKTLSSIRQNVTDIPYEIIVVDDGSTDNTFDVCKKHSVTCIWIDGGGYRNPAVPRNLGCRTARGKILIMQSDDVLHSGYDIISNLASVKRGEVQFATVWNYQGGRSTVNYCSPENPRPLFFLGSIWSEDFWAVGGNDEDFTDPGYEDTYLAESLSRKYNMVFRDDVVGLHQDHPRPKNLSSLLKGSQELYEEKLKNKGWTSSW